MEVYQWLLRERLRGILDPATLFTATDGEGCFRGQGRVRYNPASLTGNDKWIEGALLEIKKCLEKPTAPGRSRTASIADMRSLGLE